MPNEKPAPVAANTSSSTRVALNDAQAIVEAAKRRASDIHAEAEKRLQEASERGYREGFARGRTEVAHGAVRLIEESTTIGDRLATEAAKLAIAICKKIIGDQAAFDQNTVKNIAMRALQESVIGESVTIVVSPEDADGLQQHLAELRRLASGAAVSIDTDPNIARGGCLVRTDFGEVDASVEGLVDAVALRLGLKSDE